MSKRKSNDDNYEVLLKKLKEIEKQIVRKEAKKSRRVRVLSSSSSSSQGSTRLSQLKDGTSPHHVSADPELDLDQMMASPAATNQHALSELQIAQTPQEAAASVCPVSDFNPSSEDSIAELDADILQILGVDPTKTVKFGKNIQKDVALRFEHTATNGVSKDERKELIEKYLIPENCKVIGAPALNPEMKAALSETVIKRDKVIASKQTLMASAISSLGEAITHVLSSKEKDTTLLRILMDTGRALCDCQHNDTLARRNYIVFSVKKEMKESLQNARIDEFLFGQNLSDSLKAAKAINKSGAELKPSSTPRFITNKPNLPNGPKNWKNNPPRKQPPKTTEKSSSTTTKAQRASSFKPAAPLNQRPARTTSHSRR